jgi:ketosteroid isomerase-like protein
MALTPDYVAKLYENFSTGRESTFFDSVADDVQWTVMGTHPLAGVYNSKADFLKHTFDRLAKIIKGGSVIMKIDHIYVSGDTAIVEMTSTSVALNDRPYAQKFCWITRFVDGLIVEARAYLDSVLVQQLVDENERPVGSQEAT